VRIRYIPFQKLPYTDSCWSLIEGPDEKVYAAACCEHSSGGTAFIVRYDPRTEELEYLLDVAEAVGEPLDNGRATQCKIHYSMILDDDGVLYAATHLSGAAIEEVAYSTWGTFNDPLRSFVGARLLAFDTRTERVLWTDTLIPWEGCRCLALDAAARRLYAVGYPRDHVYLYDLDARRRRDLGRIGSVNPQAIWLDGAAGGPRRAYTTDDDGRIVVYDERRGGLADTDVRAPHAVYQDGWHNVVYDAVQVPDSQDVVGVTWNVDPRLFRFRPADDPAAARMDDLGPTTPGISGYGNRGVNTDHAGALVFSAGGELLYVVSACTGDGDPHGRSATLKRMNLHSGEVRDVGRLLDEAGVQIGYGSRAVRIGAEHVVFGTIGRVPTGIVHVVLDDELARGPFQATPRRCWG
jgi:hypothetical protein